MEESDRGGDNFESQVYAGINPMAKLSSFSEKEKLIIKTLAKTFYVTNGGEEIRLGATSKYRYCLIKPTDLFGEKFNLRREMVVIFSAYRKFEPRTFDAIADVFDRNKQEFRIDKVCSIIISHDNNVCEEVGNIVAGNHLAIDTRDCITYSKKRLITTIGCENLIIVETDDVILVCDKNRAQDVKLIVDKLKEDGHNELL